MTKSGLAFEVTGLTIYSCMSLSRGTNFLKRYELFVDINETVRYLRVSVERGSTVLNWISVYNVHLTPPQGSCQNWYRRFIVSWTSFPPDLFNSFFFPPWTLLSTWNDRKHCLTVILFPKNTNVSRWVETVSVTVQNILSVLKMPTTINEREICCSRLRMKCYWLHTLFCLFSSTACQEKRTNVETARSTKQRVRGETQTVWARKSELRRRAEKQRTERPRTIGFVE